jgi:hypothetical protein
LQVTTFGGRDVACKKTEEGEGNRTTKIEWRIDLPIIVTNNLRKIEALQPAPRRTIPHLFQHKVPQAPKDNSEEEASFRPLLGFRVSKATKKRLGERERHYIYIYIYLLNFEKATDLLGR